MRRLIVLAALAACSGGDDGLKYGVDPGGGGGNGSSHVTDASVSADGGDASMTVAGRVCLIADSRAPTTCANTGAGGFTVALGSAQTTTAADGAFSIARPSGTDLVWRVSGTGIVASAMRFSSTATTIPAIGTNLYNEMISANMPTVGTGQGAILAQLVSNTNAPLQDIPATTNPLSTSGIYFDGATAINWNLGTATGPFGALWIPGNNPGNVALTIDDGTATPPVISNIPVFADTITFVLYKHP